MKSPDATMPVLTPKQRRFCEEILLDMNATQAAIRAGYSARTAKEQGAQLLSKAHVREAIDAGKSKRSEKLDVDAEFVLQRLVAEVNADLADLYDESGDLKPIDEWPSIWRQGLVAGVEVEALFAGSGEERKQIGQVKKIRLSDRLRRLELIGKHIRVNAFQDQVAVTGVEALADRIARAKLIENERAASVVNMLPPPPSAERAPIATPEPPSPRPAYRPIMPAPEPAPWPQYSGQAATDYDQTT